MIAAVTRTFEEASEEARMLADRAAEAAEEGARAARRGYRLARSRAEDAADDAAACIRKQPLKAVGAALSAGLVIGAAGSFLAVAAGSRCLGRRG